MMPKDFIKNVLIEEIKDVVDRHPYLAFTLIAIGIELLGKCLMTTHHDWHDIRADKAFDKGLSLLIEENPEYGTLELRNELRNGFTHTLLPKSNIALSEIRHGETHFSKSKNGKSILVVEVFFSDFVRACEKVLSTDFIRNDKMNKAFLEIGQ